MTTALVTGYGPFGPNKENPSGQIAERLDGQTIAGITVTGRVLPVAFGEDWDTLLPLIADLRPDLILCLGLASTATHLWIERLAVNLRRRTPDETASEIAIQPGGPAAYFTTLDAERVQDALVAEGVPAAPHVYAGNYVCNHTFYQALHHVSQQNLATRVGFLHLPLSAEQTISEGRIGSPCLPWETIYQGCRAALVAALDRAENGDNYHHG